MSSYSKSIKISSLSPENLRQYFQIDVNQLGVPDDLEENNLTLYRIINNGKKESIPFQIDCINYNNDVSLKKRILFFCLEEKNLSSESCELLLTEEKPPKFNCPASLDIKYHFQKKDNKGNNFSCQWDNEEPLEGVEIFNDKLKVYIKLAAHISPAGKSYAGAITSVSVPSIEMLCEDILFPYSFPRDTETHWGQLDKLVIFPAPWENLPPREILINNTNYDLVYTRKGPLRAVATLRSRTFDLYYDGGNVFNGKVVQVKAHLYRMISLYLGEKDPCYMEDLFLLTEKGTSLNFRPYFSSQIIPPPYSYGQLQETHTQRYFSVLLKVGALNLGYSFTTNSFIRFLDIEKGNISWRLSNTTHHFNCIHLFNAGVIEVSKDFDPLSKIMHLSQNCVSASRLVESISQLKYNKKQRLKRKPNKAIHILHLSDIHFGTIDFPKNSFAALNQDLRRNLKIEKLDCLVISGDIANFSTPEEYADATNFIQDLKTKFSLKASNIVIVPGNHDVNYPESEKAYHKFVYSKNLPLNQDDKRYIPCGEQGKLERDDSLYVNRFKYFTEFYEDVCGTPYPLDRNEQSIIYDMPEYGLLFLGLNSSWMVDHYYEKRSNIDVESLANSLNKLLEKDYDNKSLLKIAVWHHPVKEMNDDECLGQLGIEQFKIFMQGHVHKADKNTYFCDEHREIKIIAAGTFGAPEQQCTGIPLQYNLLRYYPDTKKIIVHTRKKESVTGIWKADARWGNPERPRPEYTIRL